MLKFLVLNAVGEMSVGLEKSVKFMDAADAEMEAIIKAEEERVGYKIDVQYSWTCCESSMQGVEKFRTLLSAAIEADAIVFPRGWEKYGIYKLLHQCAEEFQFKVFDC